MPEPAGPVPAGDDPDEVPPPDPAPAPLGGRRSFAPTLVMGLTGAVVAAVASGRTWGTAWGRGGGVRVSASVTGSTSAPLAIALALVALAAWGVVLVLRGRVRRWVAVAGALAAAGLLVTAVSSTGRTRHDAVQAVVAKGAADAVTASLTGWLPVCAAAAAVTVLAFVVAVVAAGSWPAIGTRYDAPATAPGGEVVHGDQDMWRALDDGRDPTT